MIGFIKAVFWLFLGYLAVDYVVCTVHNRKIEQAQRAEELRKQEATRAMAIEREMSRQERQARQMAIQSFRISQIEADILAGKERLSALYALMDVAQAEQAGAVPGSKTDVKAQKQILALMNQIHTAERKLAKAEFDRQTALVA